MTHANANDKDDALGKTINQVAGTVTRVGEEVLGVLTDPEEQAKMSATAKEIASQFGHTIEEVGQGLADGVRQVAGSEEVGKAVDGIASAFGSLAEQLREGRKDAD